MSTNKQRREAARRKLERQLVARQERARRRRQTNVIASVVGTLVVIGVVVAFVVFTSHDHKKSTASSPTSASTPKATATTPSAAPTTSYPPATGAAVRFDGVTVKGAADLKGRPGVTSKGTLVPKTVLYKDLVVGKGAAATAKDSVTVQYVGALYKTGKIFDESWKRGAPATFALNGVVPGFSQGIAGVTGKIPAMKVGGRRVVIIPAALGYKSAAQGGIPANSTLVFVIDLTKTAAAAPTPSAAPTTTYPAAKGAAVQFDGVTVKGAADLKGRPGVTSKGTLVPTTVLYKDLVVGKGAAATTKDKVTVQYVGALYKTGKIFDESWKRGAPATFALNGVVPGFSQGIAGVTGKIPAMKVGGRRVIIIPAALGYKSTAQTGIPANSTLVFVIDLTKAAAA